MNEGGESRPAAGVRSRHRAGLETQWTPATPADFVSTVMAELAYHKASEPIGRLFLIGLAGVAAMLATMFVLGRTELGQRLGLWVLVIGAVPMFSAFIFGAWLLLRLKRERIGVIVARFGANGLYVRQKPTPEQQEEFAAPLAHLLPTLGLAPKGAAGIQWFCIHGAGATALRVFEHEFTTGGGRTTQIHTHTVAAWPTGHPEIGDEALATAPWFFMQALPSLARGAVRDRELKHADFADLARDWSVLGDAATGTRFLTPAVRARLPRSPRGEVWCVGAGWVCCSTNGGLTAENLERFLGHARGVPESGRR